MIEQLARDMQQRPDLFYPMTPISEDQLIIWLQERHLVVPDDLRTFWRDFGGMDLFESETILSPFGRIDLGDDMDSVNSFHRGKGMPDHYLIFHTGLPMTVVVMPSGDYACIHKDSYRINRMFSSLDDWYVNLRKEYVERYGLEDH